MKIMEIKEFVKKAKSGEIDIVENTKKILKQAEQINKENNYFNTICSEFALELAKKAAKEKKGYLLGVPISLKDSILVKDVETRAGSGILDDYKPLFSSYVVEKLIKEGAIIIGKTSQDEFGFGGFSSNMGKGFKVPLNPVDKTRCCGGSSGGTAGIVKKADFTTASLGESTGGSIVAPASFCGVIGLCPTYGRVSRNGLINYANSLDKIGPITKTIEDAAIILKVISGYDENDSTSVNTNVEDYTKYIGKKDKLKIGVIKEAFGKGVDEEIKKSTWEIIRKLEAQGISYEEVSLPLTLKYGLQTYYLIALTESSTNLACFSGMRYGKEGPLKGNFKEYFSKIRSENFGDEAKRRIILGTFARMAGYRDAYYMKAMKVRTKIIDEYKKLFKKYDILMSPTMPIIAPKLKEIEKLTPLQNYMMDVMTVGPNLAGLPHLSMATGTKDNAPIGTLFIADHFEEKKLIQIGSIVEDLI